MERCGKINSWNSVAESWTGIGVVAGLMAGVGMIEWPYLKMAQPGSYRSYLQILECVRKIGKTCNQFICSRCTLTVHRTLRATTIASRVIHAAAPRNQRHSRE